MTDIPIPFIGGAEGPRRDWPAKRKMEPPFAPGAEEESEPVEAGAEPTIDEEEFQSEQFEGGAAPVVIEIEEPIAESAFHEPEPVGEPSLAPAAHATEPPEAFGQKNLDLPDFLLGADASDTALDAEPRATAEEFAADQPEEASVSAEDTLAGTVRLETGERLAEKARQLLDGERGDWIRTLITDLSGHGLDVAVPRAFAAGYLAAKTEEDH